MKREPQRFDDDRWPYQVKPAGKMEETPWAATTAAARIRGEGAKEDPTKRSEFQRWKTRRNAVILLCHKNGLSNRFISDVFKIARAQIADIIADVKQQKGVG